MKTINISLLFLLGICLFGMTKAVADPPSGLGYVPVLLDEFNGTTLDTSIWAPNYPWGHTHNGRAAMEASQVKLGNGLLDLQAIWSRDQNSWSYTNNTGGYYDNIKNKWEELDFTSGTVYSKKRWKYGYFEGRFLIPWQQSAWPAFWMLQDGWPPELDIFEFHGSTASENYTYHYTVGSTASSWGGQATGLSATWHVFGVDWTADHITYYLDGVALKSFTDAANIADMGPMYLLIDHQIAGWSPDPVQGDGQYNNNTGSSWSGDFKVDYVRVWQTGAAGPANGTYRITPQNQPTMALEISTAPAATPFDALVDIGPANYSASQKWSLTAQSDGSYVIGGMAGTASTLRLDDSGGGTVNGDDVAARNNTGGAHQRWYLYNTGNGLYRIVAPASPGMTVEAAGGVTAGAGAKTQLYDYTGLSSQLWHLDTATAPILLITGVAATAITLSGATVGWTTSNSADTVVDYGLTATYGTTKTGTGGTTAHTLTLTGLLPSRVYHYRVRSTDIYGQAATGADATFTTAATTISGTVTLQGRTSMAYPLTFTLTPTGATTGSVLTQNITPAASGAFSLSNIGAGTYTLGVKGSSWLRTTITVDTTAGNAAGANMTLLGGDLNNDNQINGTDLSLLRHAYGSVPSSTNWNATADLNGDGQVTMLDLSLLRGNYGRNGK